MLSRFDIISKSVIRWCTVTMKVGAAAAKLAPSKPGMVAAWLGVPVWTLFVTVGNRTDSEGVEVATVLSKLAVSSLVEFAASLRCTSHCGHLI